MKKLIVLILLLTASVEILGTLVDTFRSWKNLANDMSSDIVIARCIATPGFTPPGVAANPVLNDGPGVEASVEIIAVLKGNTKPGLSKLVSIYRPCQGEMFALFANHITSQSNSWYNAIEGYRIIPLNRDFQVNDLEGKTLDEQIQMILVSRLKDLNEEIARDNEEKQRLEQGLKNGRGTLTNLPTAIHPQ